MPLPRSFKSDESFLEKIAIGATGTKRVFHHLTEQGHEPIELERGSMSFKIWKEIKIKRIRVPDLLCLKCGTRVECRAKTKMEITLSHSRAYKDRGWDFGLDDKDRIALIACEKTGEGPLDWRASDVVQYVSVRDLRKAWEEGIVKEERPKGREEGFELRVTWPSIVAKNPGRITAVSADRITYFPESGRRSVTLRLIKGGHALKPLVSVGDTVRRNQIIASVVPVSLSLPCEEYVSIGIYMDQLSSPSLTSRYTAVKALGHLATHDSKVTRALENKATDNHEHIYIRLEAAAGLIREGNCLGEKILRETLKDQYLENRLEAVIVLAEIQGDKSFEILSNVLTDPNQDVEIRAGAAWAIGEIGAEKATPLLVACFTELPLAIRVEAARALAKIARKHQHSVIAALPQSKPEERPGIAWALSKAGGFTLADLLPAMVDDDARHWVAYVIGTQPKEAFLEDIESLKKDDPEVYFATTMLWKIMESWIDGLEEY